MPVRHDDINTHADADTGVGDVEGREAVKWQVYVDEVDDVVTKQAVADIAQGAADKETKGQLAALQFAQELLAPAPHECEHREREENQERADIVLGAQPPGGALVADMHDPEAVENHDRRAGRIASEVGTERDMPHHEQLGRDVHDDRDQATGSEADFVADFTEGIAAAATMGATVALELFLAFEGITGEGNSD